MRSWKRRALFASAFAATACASSGGVGTTGDPLAADATPHDGGAEASSGDAAAPAPPKCVEEPSPDGGVCVACDGPGYKNCDGCILADGNTVKNGCTFGNCWSCSSGCCVLSHHGCYGAPPPLA